MYPILYNANEIDFTHNGLGLLKDSVKVVAIEELNGMFELHIEYDSEGFLVETIKEEMIVKAKANDKQKTQLFRIYSITKSHENDNLIIDAQHITYDLAYNFVEELEAHNLSKKQVMEKIGTSAVLPHRFNITSSNDTTLSSTSLYRTNPLQMVAGMQGSVLQIWGGQIERDNFNLILHDRRGSDNGVKILYRKNLTGLEAKFDITQLATRIFPFVYDEENKRLVTIVGKYIDSPYVNDYEQVYILPVDFSDKFENVENVTPTQLFNAASGWFIDTGNDKPKVEIEVKFEHLWEAEEYKDLAVLELVGMGDTVTVVHTKLNVDVTAIVNRIEYDVIAEKNIEVGVGSVKAKITDSVNRVSDVAERVVQVEHKTDQALKTANGKNTIYYGVNEPISAVVGDIWFKTVDGEYTRTYRFDGIQWQIVLSGEVKDTYDEAQEAKNTAQQAVNKANELSSSLEGVTVRVGNNEKSVSSLTQTSQSLQTQITDNKNDTQSKYTQLSDDINLRVQKDDVINQINVDTSGVLISGKKLILDGDTTVTGTFKVSDANITSLNAGKLTTGTLDAGKVSVINLDASNINAGKLTAVDIEGVTIKGSTVEGGILRSSDRPSYSDLNYTNRALLENGKLIVQSKSTELLSGVTSEGIATIMDGAMSLEGVYTYFPVGELPPVWHPKPDSTTIYSNALIKSTGNLMLQASGGLIGFSDLWGNEIAFFNGSLGMTDFLFWGSYPNQDYIALRAYSSFSNSFLRSDLVKNKTYSSAANVYITSDGVLGRATSARKYKLLEEPLEVDPYKLLELEPKTWYDKRAVEDWARELEGEEVEFQKVHRHPGLVAEDVADAGLEMFVTFGDDGEIEGLQYDRLWTLLIPIVKDQQKKIEELDAKLLKLEGV